MTDTTIINDNLSDNQNDTQNSQTLTNLSGDIDEQKAAQALLAFQNGVAKSVINKPISSEMQKYFEGLIESSGMPVYDEETKKQIIRDLFVRFSKFVSLKTIEQLSEDNSKTFLQMVSDNKSSDELEKFLIDSIQNLDDVLSNALVDFRDFYLTAQSNFTDMKIAGNPA